MRAPIRLRLTGWYVLLLVVALVALGTFVITRLRSDLTGARDRSLREGAAQIAQGYALEGAPEFHDKALTVLPDLFHEGSGAQVLDPTGLVVLSYGDPVSEAPLLTPVQLRRVLDGRHLAFDLHAGRPAEHLYAVALPVTRRGRHQALVVVQSLAGVDHAVHRVFVLLLVGSVGALALIAFGGWWIARKALRPVERMTTRAEQIGISDIPNQRLTIPRVRDEVSHLARTLNAMFDRLQEGVEARERLIADASHELRAPLAAMRSELDVSLGDDELASEARAVLLSARIEVVRLSSIVENLLTLARVDGGRLELLLEPYELGEVVAQAIRVHGQAAQAAGVELRVTGESCTVACDRERARQVVSNLLDNAIRYAPSGSVVLVKLWQSGGEAGVVVTDQGPGIPVPERERIFERFARRDRARSRDAGAGLGLAISREIVRAHGGRIWVGDHAGSGSGGTFVVALPRTAASDQPNGEPRREELLTAPAERSPPSPA